MVSRSQGLEAGDAIDSDDEEDGTGGMQYILDFFDLKLVLVLVYNIYDIVWYNVANNTWIYSSSFLPFMSFNSAADLDEIQEENEEMDQEEPEPVIPRVDADGWETVIRGTKKTGKKK